MGRLRRMDPRGCKRCRDARGLGRRFPREVGRLDRCLLERGTRSWEEEGSVRGR